MKTWLWVFFSLSSVLVLDHELPAWIAKKRLQVEVKDIQLQNLLAKRRGEPYQIISATRYSSNDTTYYKVQKTDFSKVESEFSVLFSPILRIPKYIVCANPSQKTKLYRTIYTSWRLWFLYIWWLNNMVMLYNEYFTKRINLIKEDVLLLLFIPFILFLYHISVLRSITPF